MNELPKHKISNRGGELRPGDRLGMFIDHETIDHPIYGKATKLTGLFPLFYRHGEFKYPSILNDPPRMKKLTKEMTAQLKYLWEEELDEDIEIQVRNAIVMGSMVIHGLDIELESDMGRQFILGGIVSFLFDDIVDNMDIEETGITFKSVSDLLDQALKGDVGDIPNLTPKLVPFLRFLSEYKKGNANVTHFANGRDKYFIKEMKNAFVSYISIAGNDKNIEEGFSEETLADMHGCLCGLVATLEAVSLFEPTDVPIEIREDILFQRLKSCTGNVSTLENALAGLRRDVENNCVEDTPILKMVVHKGMSLQDAWDKVCQQLHNGLRDIRVAARKLRERYPNNPATLNYIHCAEDIADNQFYYYLCSERYGENGMRIQKIE